MSYQIGRSTWRMNPGLPAAGPCRNDPVSWDIPDDVPGHTQVKIAEDAVLACLDCPAVAGCAKQLRANPPDYDCVQAAVVWWRSRPYTLAQFTALRDKPCGTPAAVARHLHRKEPLCGKCARYERIRAREARRRKAAQRQLEAAA